MSLQTFRLLLQTVKSLPHLSKGHFAISFFEAMLPYQFKITFTEELSKGGLQLKLEQQTLSKASMSWAPGFSAFLLNIVSFGFFWGGGKVKGRVKEG